MNVRSIADLNRAIVNNLTRLDRNAFDAVVGIPRSGLLPATLIATHLQKPLSDVEGFIRGNIFRRNTIQVKAERILLVDDSVNKGRSMLVASTQIKRALPTTKIIRFAVYGPYQVEPWTKVVDFYCEDCKGPRAFQWNLWRHVRLPKWCLDMDGVICRDPRKDENDDGPRYKAFLQRAEPLFLPTRPVGHIVTCRLEKYRAETEDWLRRHQVQFGKLHMMPYGTKIERMEAGGRGQWKAEIFKQVGAEFFIESNPRQAEIIAARTGAPVWCTSTQQIIGT